MILVVACGASISTAMYAAVIATATPTALCSMTAAMMSLLQLQATVVSIKTAGLLQ